MTVLSFFLCHCATTHLTLKEKNQINQLALLRSVEPNILITVAKPYEYQCQHNKQASITELSELSHSRIYDKITFTKTNANYLVELQLHYSTVNDRKSTWLIQIPRIQLNHSEFKDVKLHFKNLQEPIDFFLPLYLKCSQNTLEIG